MTFLLEVKVLSHNTSLCSYVNSQESCVVILIKYIYREGRADGRHEVINVGLKGNKCDYLTSPPRLAVSPLPQPSPRCVEQRNCRLTTGDIHLRILPFQFSNAMKIREFSFKPLKVFDETYFLVTKTIGIAPQS